MLSVECGDLNGVCVCSYDAVICIHLMKQTMCEQKYESSGKFMVTFRSIQWLMLTVY